MPGSEKPQRGDEAQLFEEYHPRLVRLVGAEVNTTPEIVEDACSFAWTQFLRYQPDRNRGWKSWLFRTAQREAWRLTRERRETVTIDEVDPSDRHDYHEQRLQLLAAIDVLEQLPPRLRRIAFLRAAGVRYSAIMEITGDSHTRLSSLVTRANDHIHRVLEETRDDNRNLPPRVARLRELEKAPPPWLAQLGRAPRGNGRREAFGTQLLNWRRAALAIDDYRALTGFSDPDRPIGERPRGDDARRTYDVAQRAIDALHASRNVSRELGGGVNR